MDIKTRRSRCCTLALLALAGLASGPAAQAQGSTAPRYAFCSEWVEKTASMGGEFTTAFRGEGDWIFFTPDFSPMNIPSDRDVLALKQLVDTLAAKGTRLVMVVPPTRGVVEERYAGPYRSKYLKSDDQVLRRAYRAAISALERGGAIVPDLQAAVDRAKLPVGASYYRKQDNHWHADGARLTALAVAEDIRKKVDLSKLPRVPQVSRVTTTGPYRTLVMDEIADICGPKTIGRDQEQTWITEPAGGEAAAGGDLLGETVSPVVLVGTSFSRPDGPYNFGGFLAEALGMDVLNVAVPGGKVSTSILSYLGSEDFIASPPAVLVWEVRPADLPHEDFLGQVVATLSGSCPTGQALLKQDTKLQRGLTQVMALTPEQRGKIKSSAFLDLTVGETGVNKYLLRLNYTDFSKEDVEVDLTRAVFPPGHFFHTLPVDRLRKLESISLRPAARLYGTVSVSLCPSRRAS